jgi:hypothetical protein
MTNDLAPFVGTVGGGFFIGFITGYAIKKCNQAGRHNSWTVYFCVRIVGISANSYCGLTNADAAHFSYTCAII